MFARPGVSLVGRWAIACVAALVVAALLDPAWAEAAKKKKKKPKRVERVAEGDYVLATGFRGVQDSPCVYPGVGCVTLPVEPGERFVTIDVEDAAGEPVWVSLYVYGYSDGTDSHEHVCGSSDQAFSLSEGLTELVVVTTQTTATATSPCPGAATSGTVTATFSNLE